MLFLVTLSSEKIGFCYKTYSRIVVRFAHIFRRNSGSFFRAKPEKMNHTPLFCERSEQNFLIYNSENVLHVRYIFFKMILF